MKRSSKKAAGTQTTTEDIAQEYLAVANARNRFMAVTLNMGWRLAISFLVPILIGVKIDDHFKTSPSYTLAAFMLGVFISVLVIKDTIEEVNEEQAAEEAAEAKTAKKKAKEL